MSDLTPCVVSNDVCGTYLPGHSTHWTHAKHVGRTPWGWRDAVVTRIRDGWTSVAYVEGGHRLRLWHHADLAGELVVGAPVRVHEQYSALGGPFGWLTVVVRGGIGRCPMPADPAAWAGRVTGAVQDLSGGRALPRLARARRRMRTRGLSDPRGTLIVGRGGG